MQRRFMCNSFQNGSYVSFRHYESDDDDDENDAYFDPDSDEDPEFEEYEHQPGRGQYYDVPNETQYEGEEFPEITFPILVILLLVIMGLLYLIWSLT